MIAWCTDDPDAGQCLFGKKRDIPWNWINVSKLFGMAALFVLSVIDLVTAIKSAVSSESDVYNVDIYTPVIKLLTFALSAVLLVYNRKYGLSTSGLQFLFWLLMALCGAIQFRTEIRGSQEDIPESSYSYISYLIYYPIILVMLFLNCFVDYPPRRSEYSKLQVQIKNLKTINAIKKTDEEKHRVNTISLKLTTTGLTIDQLDKDIELLIIPRNRVAHPQHAPAMKLQDVMVAILFKTIFQKFLSDDEKHAINNIRKAACILF